MDEYLLDRRVNASVQPMLLPLELHLNIPDEVYYQPMVKEIQDLIADLIGIDNVRHFNLFASAPFTAHTYCILRT